MKTVKDVKVYVSTARIIALMKDAQFDKHKVARCYANQEIIQVRNSDIHSMGVANK